MDFEKLFRILSYATVFCGFLSLWIGGAFGWPGPAMFVSCMGAAWFLEGRKWQVSERLGTALIVLALPVYFGLWQIGFFSYGGPESVLPGILARLILTLSAIKLLQYKSDRDWIFLYIMSFFQVLLAAGLSISALYLASFIAFSFCMVCTIILFEMQKTNRTVAQRSATGSEKEPARLAINGLPKVPVTAAILIVAIIAIATPLFFLLPRVGGAGIGADPGGLSTRTGFSDSVRLGGIGRIQENDAIVMRVRLEGNDTSGNLRWRGLAHDTFDGQTWSRSRGSVREPRVKGERDIIQVDFATGRESLLLQTVYLEPLDTAVLFAAPRAVGIQGNFPVVVKDAYNGISFQRSGERVSYKVLSDTSLPTDTELRSDNGDYSVQSSNYLQLPGSLDPRISDLAARVIDGKRSRFDASRAIEHHLQTQYGYTLEQKAGGTDPLLDFLFNVREGHCEYFATAMVMMLRTQGIAARLTTGFQQGEYNETADVFVVRQRHAHAWVEVYFPKEDAWVPFDPTPAAGRGENLNAAGITSIFGKYLEALETFWIQYFVAFDNQEQRTLLTSVKRSFSDYQASTSGYLDTLQALIAEWWKDVRGENGARSSLAAVGYGAAILGGAAVAILLVIYVLRKIRRLGLFALVAGWFRPKERRTAVEFYERMTAILASKGFVRSAHQTPLEFARLTGIVEVVGITDRYNSVRFGAAELSPAESKRIEAWLASFGSKG